MTRDQIIATLKAAEPELRKRGMRRCRGWRRVVQRGVAPLRAVLVRYRLSRADVDELFAAGIGRRSKLAGRKVKPKFRNPTKKSETWSGRGMQPRWLVAAIRESGKMLEHFAI